MTLAGAAGRKRPSLGRMRASLASARPWQVGSSLSLPLMAAYVCRSCTTSYHSFFHSLSSIFLGQVAHCWPASAALVLKRKQPQMASSHISFAPGRPIAYLYNTIQLLVRIPSKRAKSRTAAGFSFSFMTAVDSPYTGLVYTLVYSSLSRWQRNGIKAAVRSLIYFAESGIYGSFAFPKLMLFLAVNFNFSMSDNGGYNRSTS